MPFKLSSSMFRQKAGAHATVPVERSDSALMSSLEAPEATSSASDVFRAPKKHNFNAPSRPVSLTQDLQVLQKKAAKATQYLIEKKLVENPKNPTQLRNAPTGATPFWRTSVQAVGQHQSPNPLNPDRIMVFQDHELKVGAKTMRISVQVNDPIHFVDRTSEQLLLKYFSMPTLDQVVEALSHMPMDKLRAIDHIELRTGVAIEQYPSSSGMVDAPREGAFDSSDQGIVLYPSLTHRVDPHYLLHLFRHEGEHALGWYRLTQLDASGVPANHAVDVTGMRGFQTALRDDLKINPMLQKGFPWEYAGQDASELLAEMSALFDETKGGQDAHWVKDAAPNIYRWLERFGTVESID
jgi:hypothetical protein